MDGAIEHLQHLGMKLLQKHTCIIFMLKILRTNFTVLAPVWPQEIVFGCGIFLQRVPFILVMMVKRLQVLLVTLRATLQVQVISSLKVKQKDLAKNE